MSPPTFLALDRPASWEEARFVVLPAPFEASTSYGRGAADGPRAIIAASAQVEEFDADYGFAFYQRAPVHTLPAADCAGGAAAVVETLYAEAARQFAAGKFLLTLGGEHSVSIGPIRAAAARFPGLTVLHVDAHADLRDSWLGDRYSHASVMRRVVDAAPLVQVGLRQVSEEEDAFIRGSGRVLAVTAAQLRREPALIDRAVERLSDFVYLSIDVDGLDPSVIAHTGTPVPGGLRWEELLALIDGAARTRRLVAADVTELAPGPDSRASDFAAALLCAKIMTAVTAYAAGSD